MNIEKFELEWWLNPLDAIATYNMGSSCCKPMNMQELFELDGVSRDEVMDEIANMSLHYGYFEGMPRLKDAVAATGYSCLNVEAAPYEKKGLFGRK